MKVYALVARIDDCYTSTTLLGIYPAKFDAVDAAAEKFSNVVMANEDPTAWIADNHLISLEDRTSMVVAQMRGVNTHDGCNEDVDIAVLEFGLK
ncbi:hypothetical protein Acj9p034 [Acinetobacter phage Acj9]|uniref:Uncharacterized protein n=1 Tax=Acinetobacter phage Acj9 TaxID=760939 RepID=E5EPG8_9CAUD|nr:hypothetical protein Acj9p034 [Acinetobacter phage Acj9]ADG59934.1 hypothetical protein Acj9p034 [Acinetobacter phage Acj9]